ncbi:MAG TPA: pentapeptide repeat-containing protein [Malonomonas sp.]
MSQPTAEQQLPLREQDLRGASLNGADLRDLDLSGCDLAGAQLFRADLRGANLQGAELAAANLEGAILDEVKAQRAGFGQANLRGASLFLADLQEATLTQANLQGTNLNCVNLGHARLREADLSGADLSEADLRYADLSLSNVHKTNFSNADLRHARLRMMRQFKNALWVGVDIRDINFAGAYLMRQEIIDQNFIKEFRSYNWLSQVLYYPWMLTCDCGRSMFRWCCCIGVMLLVFAYLYTLVEIDYGAYETALSPLYFSVVTMTTLGFGDVMPKTVGAQLVTMLEVSTGYIMLGGLLSIFSNKLARRGD